MSLAAHPIWDPELYARHGSYVPRMALDLLDWLSPQAGETILDLGCGDGVLTERIAAAHSDVMGVDSSAELVHCARGRGLQAQVMDAHELPFARQFDAVFSNAAMHWMRDLDAVVAGVHRSLRPGGRFVAEMGGHGNVQSVVGLLEAALQRRGIDPRGLNPWTFPTREAMRARLQQHGFLVSSVRLFPRPTRLPQSLRGWLDTFAGPFLETLAVDERAALVDEVVDAWEATHGRQQGHWVLDYVRLRFCALALPGHETPTA